MFGIIAIFDAQPWANFLSDVSWQLSIVSAVCYTQLKQLKQSKRITQHRTNRIAKISEQSIIKNTFIEYATWLNEQTKLTFRFNATEFLCIIAEDANVKLKWKNATCNKT